MSNNTQFWLKNPYILFDPNNVTDLWPSDSMSLDRKLNAISRLIIFLTILGFLLLRSIPLLMVGIVTLFAIVILKNNFITKDKIIKTIAKEGFTNPDVYEYMKDNFTKPTPQNPMGNVLLPEIQDNPDRKSAPPAFNPKVETEINNSTKKMIDELNPTNEDLSKKLFADLGDGLEFEQSMRQFVTNPSTRIPNDRETFQEYLFGDMISCRDGDDLACVRNNFRQYPGY